MTVHQAKGLEWESVLVAAIPGKNDHINIAEMYASPQIIGANVENEFVRIYYVACSRAIKNLYIHYIFRMDALSRTLKRLFLRSPKKLAE